MIAGYGVGELAAWGCAGALDGPSTLRLAQHRAALMDAAARGARHIVSHMAAALFPDGCARAVEEFRTLPGLRTWLQRAMG